MRVQCKTCGGVYETVGADGMEYYHTCPPLSVRELKAAINARAVQLSAPFSERLQAAQDADAKRAPDATDPPAVDLLLASIAVARPGTRDENVIGGRADDKEQIRAAGRGVVELDSAPAAPPIVVTGTIPGGPVLP